MSDKEKTELAYHRGQLGASLYDANLCLTKATEYLRILIRDAGSMTPEQIQTALCAIEAQRLDILVPLKAAMAQLQNVIRLTPIGQLPVHCSPYALRRSRGLSSQPARAGSTHGDEQPPPPADRPSTPGPQDKPLQGDSRS